MESLPKLAPLFLLHARGPAAWGEDVDLLERTLARACAAACEPWPDVKVPEEFFVPYFAERLSPDAKDPLEQVLEDIHLSDLYLACGCIHGVPGALAALERHYLSRIASFLRSPRRSPQLIEDVCQNLREKLLVRSNRPPHLLNYNGDGKLRKWLEVIAFRLANAVGKAKAEQGEDLQAVADQLQAPDNVERGTIRAELQGAFRSVLHEVVAELEEEERELLRYYMGDKLPEAKIAVLFHKTQPTISRWLKASKERILHRTRSLLRERFRLSESELDSFIEDARSRLELSLSQIFGTTPSPPPD